MQTTHRNTYHDTVHQLNADSIVIHLTHIYSIFLNELLSRSPHTIVCALHSIQHQSENVLHRYRLCTCLSRKKISMYNFTFLLIRSLFLLIYFPICVDRLLWLICNCQLLCAKNTHMQSQKQQHIKKTKRQITIDTRNLENVHIIRNIFVWYLNKLFIVKTKRVLWPVWYEFNAAGNERLRFCLSFSPSTSISHISHYWLNSKWILCAANRTWRVYFF